MDDPNPRKRKKEVHNMKMKRIAAILLVLVLSASILAGCSSGPKNLTMEPFAVKWGLTREEAGDLLKCVYMTNQRDENSIFVLNSQNNNALKAFGTTPNLILYSFNLTKSGSDTPLLGEITMSFPKEDYDQVLAALEKACGKCYYENPMWGVKDANVYLFDNGTLSISYSSNPHMDPNSADKENRETILILSSSIYKSQKDITELTLNTFSLLGRYSTAETDFVQVDNSK